MQAIATNPKPDAEKTELVGNILTTCREDFFRHALPMAPGKKPGAMAPAFLSAALTRAKAVAAMLGHDTPDQGGFDVIGTTPSIVAGLRAVYGGTAAPGTLDTLRKAQMHHLKHRDLSNPMMQILGAMHNPRTVPDITAPKIGFGN